MLDDLTKLQSGLASLQHLIDVESEPEENELEANLASLETNMASLRTMFSGDESQVKHCFSIIIWLFLLICHPISL
jgi:hypothetical protein